MPRQAVPPWQVDTTPSNGDAWLDLQHSPKRRFGTLMLEKIVTRVHILVLRGVLGIVFGVVLTRLFYPDASLRFMVGLCTILVGLSYLTEYLRRRKK